MTMTKGGHGTGTISSAAGMAGVVNIKLSNYHSWMTGTGVKFEIKSTLVSESGDPKTPAASIFGFAS
jgi:hypothetical protein